jgi:nicotinic acid mononucleotide adenylyltransferase/predicted amino acid-binding ACT domain protein
MKNFINNIKTELSNHKMTNKKDLLMINNFFNSKSNISKIIRLIQNENFDSNRIFSIFKPLLEAVSDNGLPISPMEHFYEVTLVMNFPDVLDEPLDNSYEKVTHIYLTLLRVFLTYEKNNNVETWESAYSIDFLTNEEISELESPIEYVNFIKYYKEDYVEEMMKLNQEVMGFSTFKHVCGVHYLSLNIARQLKSIGIKVDLGRVSGAAAGHDIGKFGCKKEEQNRVAYFHYYYTGEWFKKRDIIYIRNVAINHSTWDLELENLSLEALILIYADFRVKADRDAKGQESMKFYSLKEAFSVILNKLDNVDDAKENRYRRVYDKLTDFEAFLLDHSINIEPNEALNQPLHLKEKLYSIMQGNEIIENAVYLSIKHNINLMYKLRNETSLNKLLEEARNTRNTTVTRGYIEAFDRYSTYLTQKQKIIIIEFLYNNLVSKEEDVRELCGKLLGKLIATYDEKLRKELPEGAVLKKTDYTTMRLFKEYIEKTLTPPKTIIEKHEDLIGYSLREIVLGYFENIGEELFEESIDLLVGYFNDPDISEKQEFYLLKLTRILKYKYFKLNQMTDVINFVMKLVFASDKKLKLRALNAFYEIYPYINEEDFEKFHIRELVSDGVFNKQDPAENFAWFKLAETINSSEEVIDQYRKICLEDLKYTSEIFLSNLKTATYPIQKRFQIELLLRNTILHDYQNIFYAAQHLCNLLKVSALENVRNTAGKSLIKIFPYLSFEQKNDIVVELIRSLEMESYEFTKYIPLYLGELLLHLKPIEFDEIIDHFYEQIETNNSNLIALFQKTAGVSIVKYTDYKNVFIASEKSHNDRLTRLLGIILSGFSHDESFVKQMALNVIGSDIFKSEELSLEEKKVIFNMLIKKLITLIMATDESHDLVFINNASALKEIYNFISEYRFQKGDLTKEFTKKIAFFPGAFDPFSRSHRTIAIEIRNMGFEVHLGVDEFSWSKSTQPNLIRRNIIERSIAKEFGIYTLPKEISVNIANEIDLENLKNIFPQNIVYLAVGSDVLVNASAYKGSFGKILEFPHVVFERPNMMNSKDFKVLKKIFKKLNEKSMRLTLSEKYEHISSTQIRNYIDTNRDISDLVDSFAERYIYTNGLYKKEPQFKNIINAKSLGVELIEEFDDKILKELSKLSNIPDELMYEGLKIATAKPRFRIIIIRNIENDNRIIGFSGFRWIRSSEIHLEIENNDLMNYVIDQSSGRIVALNFIFANNNSKMNDIYQMVLSETLSFLISRDYSYCVYIEKIRDELKSEMSELFLNQGFVEVPKIKCKIQPFAVNLTSPIVLNLDVGSMFKDEYRNNKNIVAVIKNTRKNLQRAIAKLYPGKLIVNYNRTMLYENLIKEVCEANNVPIRTSKAKNYGDAMCVPFGAIFKRVIIPNTVTKTLHVEKYFNKDLSFHEIMASPYYMDIDNQIKMIKSFNRPIILVDDLLNKGYRLKVLEPILKKYDIKVEKLIVGIMSGKGKALIENKDYDVVSPYFLPSLKVWFYESKLYPFIGGDGAWKEKLPMRNFIESINMMMPYTYPHYIKDASREDIMNLSEVALKNAYDIMRVVEYEYQILNHRMLTLERLGEVLINPRFPDKGDNMYYDMHIKPSDYINEDMNLLKRLE